jgi:DNA-binding response OmpR family regulator
MARARALIVEDVRHLAHFVDHILKKAGYETMVVHHGDEVLPAVQSFSPHALLLDMVLPGMSGPEICRVLNEEGGRENLVVIIVTGHSFDDASAAEVEEARADWIFSKPIGPVSLLAKLRELGVPPQIEEALT